MAEEKDDDFEFEVEGVDIEVEDDTPPEDRNRQPLPKELVDELEADELEDYSDKVKVRLKQMKKVWHDERREKERYQREQNEAVTAAQRLMQENQQLRNTLSQGEGTLIKSFQQTAGIELETARREFKEAYESGDADKLVAAQEHLQDVQQRISQLKAYKPTLQAREQPVQNTQQQSAVQAPDQKTLAWQERNSWWGSDPEMTASALGLHQKLEKQHGNGYVGTDEYWSSIDTTMRRRFPEYFGETETKAPRAGKSATVVAPASRSTSSKKIVLSQSQVNLAKKLGITPEQYAREFAKTRG
jgi:hypothetical protein